MRLFDQRAAVQVGVTGMLLAWLALFSAGCAARVLPVIQTTARPVSVIIQANAAGQWALFAYAEAAGGVRVVQLTAWMATPEAALAVWHR